MYAHAVFDFTFAEVVQVRLPMRILFQIFGNVVGNQDVSGVAANGFSQRTRSRAERNPNVQPALSRGSKSLKGKHVTHGKVICTHANQFASSAKIPPRHSRLWHRPESCWLNTPASLFVSGINRAHF